MNVKSLLCAAAMLSVCSVAQAFPDYTLYPEEGTLNDAQYFSSVVLKFNGGNLQVADGAEATLMCNETGEDVYSTDFDLYMGDVVINFDESEILDNGKWIFTIPAASFSVDGEDNPEIIAVYTLDDPNLGLGDFPQIELLSADPADGTKWPVWGGSYFDRVKLKTTDDDAVNYIEWFLYDVTNGEEPGVAEYMVQGNDNRYDFNRYKHHDDIWTDGLYIAVASNEKLIEGHKYRLDLRFCGRGYNDEKNEYPTPQQLDASTELETSLYYYGLTPGPEYSPYVYESVIPDPASGYVISSLEWAHFLVTYSGPVMPVAFNYALAVGVANAGTWAVADGAEVDADGYANAWEFKFNDSVVEGATGGISVSIQTQDKDGLDVRGNQGMVFDDVLYQMDWECNLGAPALLSVEPTDGSEVESLSSITISNERDLEMAIYYGVTRVAQISDRSRAVVRELGEPKISEDGKQATWTFDPITDSGAYSLYISDKYFVLGQEFDSYYTNAVTFTYVVESGTTPGGVYDLMPVEINPEDNSELKSFSTLILTFDNVVFCPYEDPKIQLYKDGEEAPIQEVAYDWDESVIQTDDMFAPTVYTINFTEVKEDGSYKIVIPQGFFYDATFDETGGDSGHASPEIILYYTIGANSGVDAIIGGDKIINVYDLNGVQILNNADVEAAKELKDGVYIINGKKVVIRR